MLQKYMNEIMATRIIFLIAGMITAAWAAIVPYAKVNTGINDAVLGSLLLCLGAGAMISMPLAGAFTSRYGCKNVMIVSTIIMVMATPFLSFISHPILLGGFLLIFGVGVGTTECAMNIQSITVERNAHKPLMSGFHGMFSLGGIVGAGLMTALLWFGIHVIIATFLVLFLIIFLFLISFRHFLSHVDVSGGPFFAIPKGIVLILGLICFVVFLVEGTALDWSSVYLVDAKHIQKSLGGLGYVSFAIAMTGGRLSGDFIVHKIGSLRVVITGTITTLIGFYCIITGVQLLILLMGYFLIGAGCSNIVPVMFNQIGKQTTMSQATAVSAVSTLGYTGILAGPAGIGFIAHQSSLSHAFIFVALLMVIVLILTFTLQKTMKHQTINKII